MPAPLPRARSSAPPRGASRITDPIGLSWLITVRWTTLGAAALALALGKAGLDASTPLGVAVSLLGVFALSNLWLTWGVARRHARATPAVAGAMVCADVCLLSWLLLRSGGVLNPASVFYLVEIVLAALVLGRSWTWIVTGLAVAGYATLFLAPSDELRAAQGMHPEIAAHMHGMWAAFAVTAVVIGVLVTRLAVAVERRDRALEALHDRAARMTRFAGLTTLVAGAAHELSTPLASMAVAARELEVSLERRTGDRDLCDDARMIRAEVDRCRRVLDEMSGRVAEPMGEAPQSRPLSDILAEALGRLCDADRARVDLGSVSPVTVVWPSAAVVQAVGNIVRNALQASAGDARVRLDVEAATGGPIRIVTTDRGCGMSADELARAGEPFYTTKAAGAGTGLGLFVARSAVEQLGGALDIRSQLGRGTTVTVTLPRDVLGKESPPGD